jgi:hypothetical protein
MIVASRRPAPVRMPPEEASAGGAVSPIAQNPLKSQYDVSTGVGGQRKVSQI